MSDLQIGLIVLGVLLILLLLGFNWWQDRRVRQRMEDRFPTASHDPLLGQQSDEPVRHDANTRPAPQPTAPRREPGMGGDAPSTSPGAPSAWGAAGSPAAGSPAAASTAASSAGASSAHASSVGASSPAAGSPAAGSPAAASTAAASTAAAPAQLGDLDDIDEPDPAVEAVIEIVFGNPVRGADLLPYMQGLRQVGRKSMRVFAETDGQRHRARVLPSEHYTRLQLAVLLANRSGALTAIEWSQAWARAQDLAERFDALVEGPEQQPVLEQAFRLDEVCARLDAQVGLTLLLGCAQPAGEVLAVAREMGFAHDGPRLAWMSDEGIPRFTLARGDGAPFDAGVGGVAKLNLLLDVPCSPADDHAFGRMVDVGRELASRLRAELVDDQGRPVGEGADTSIDDRLVVLFGHLEKSGLRAGSARARRVFS